jgi:MFS family permease
LAAAFLHFPQSLVNNVWELLVLRPKGQKGAAFGWVNGLTHLGFALGPMTGAVVAAVFGMSWVFSLTGIVLIISACGVNLALSGISTKPASDSEKKVSSSQRRWR